MLSNSVIVGASFAYLVVLFGVARYGDRRADAGPLADFQPWVYAFVAGGVLHGVDVFGSVGRAATSGLGFCRSISDRRWSWASPGWCC